MLFIIKNFKTQMIRTTLKKKKKLNLINYNSRNRILCINS